MFMCSTCFARGLKFKIENSDFGACNIWLFLFFSNKDEASKKNSVRITCLLLKFSIEACLQSESSFFTVSL